MKTSANWWCLVVLAAATVAGCSASPEKEALAKIEAVGGSVTSDSQGHIVSVNLSDTQASDEEVAAIAALRDVQTINCTNAPRIQGTTLAALATLPKLETLYLVGTSVDDAGAAQLAHIKTLKTLHLGRTKVTDAGLAAVDELVNLQTLILGETAVTDAGLVQLRDLKNLSTLILRNTKVTPRGIQEMRRIRPEARIQD